jgi:uncharacterized protein YcfJ
MLAPTLAGNTPRTAVRRRWRATRSIALDMAILAATAALCAVFFVDGGLEALLGGMIGAAIGARAGNGGIVSGALGGLFVGTMFAGLFHEALASLVSALI